MLILLERKDWSVRGDEEVFDEGQSGDVYVDFDA